MSEDYAKTLIGEVVEKLKEAEVKIEDIWEALLHHTKKVAAENAVGNSGTPATSADAVGTVSTNVTPSIESGGVEAEPSTVETAPGNPA
jgi:hypothetical protein